MARADRHGDWQASPYGQGQPLPRELCESIPPAEGALVGEIEFFWQSLLGLGGECSASAGNLVGCVRLSPRAAAQHLWKLLKTRTRHGDAPLEPIARQAQCPELARAIAAVGGNLRRCLRRRQKLLPLQNITEFDRHCLLWFLRQPGNSMEEKAGARQRLMGLERHESHDTPENRVFQDFLRRSVEAASGYLQNFPGSHHREAVRGHGDRCQTLLREESIRSIPRLAAPPRPSYVLQYERNYHTIWTNYQDLVLHRRRRDDLLRWRHRLWRDAAAWALAVAIFHLENFRTIASDAVYVLQQQQEGRWTEFPSLILHGSWRLSPRPGEGNLSPRDRLRAWHGRRAELTLWNLHSDAMPLNFTPLRDLGADFLLEVAEGERRRRISIRCAYDWDPEGEDCPGAGEGPELPAGAWENPDSPVQGITLRPGRRAGVRDDALTLPVPLTPDSVERWHGNFAQTLEALLR